MESIAKSVGERQEELVEVINTPTRWFGMVPAWVIEETGKIGVEGLGLYALLCIYANKNTKQCFPSQERLAKDAALSIPTVRDRLKKMEDCGLIRVLEKGNGRGNSTVYEIVNKLVYKRVNPLSPLDVKGKPNEEKGKPPLPERANAVCTNISNEHIQEQSVEKQFSSVATPTVELSPDDVERNRKAITELRRQLNERGVLRAGQKITD